MQNYDDPAKQAHIQRVLDQVDLVGRRLARPPQKILDIGAGVAEHGREFQKRYGSELWIIEGNSTNNAKKKSTAVKSKFRESTEDFLYYHELDILKARIEKLGGTNFHLLDCENINIQPDVKFDLITSWKSCGYHYPVNSYADLIKRHSHPGTLVVMDIRLTKSSLELDKGWQVVEELYRHKNKYITCVIKLDA